MYSFYDEQFNTGPAYLISNVHFKLCNVVNLVSTSDVYLEGIHAVLTNLSYPEIIDVQEHSCIKIDKIIKRYLYSSRIYLEVPDISLYEKGSNKGETIHES